MKIYDVATKAAETFGGYVKPGIRVWTRGDHVRYKDPTVIVTDDADSWWDAFLSTNQLTPSMQVRGEFGSSTYGDAVIHEGIVFVKREFSIQVSSKSILRNSSVWNSREIT